MIYTDDPRDRLHAYDPGETFQVDTFNEPVDIDLDHKQAILTVHFDPYQARRNPTCPFCQAPIHRLRLFDVDLYSIETPPYTWVNRRAVGLHPDSRGAYRITAFTRAVEYSPCPHVIAPYTPGWWRRYAWPQFMRQEFPVPRENWGVPLDNPNLPPVSWRIP